MQAGSRSDWRRLATMLVYFCSNDLKKADRLWRKLKSRQCSPRNYTVGSAIGQHKDTLNFVPPVVRDKSFCCEQYGTPTIS